jgi:hypothetical protein
MKLDLSSLQKAVESLEKTIKVAENKALAAKLDEDAKYLMERLQERND